MSLTAETIWKLLTAVRERRPLVHNITNFVAVSYTHLDVYKRQAQCQFEQFLFYRQWAALKQYANERGILIFGDIPLFVGYDSADVWARRDCFLLDAEGRPEVVAGVPPDYFSATGQLWGNPHYAWAAMRADGFQWRKERIRTQLTQFDLLRICLLYTSRCV